MGKTARGGSGRSTAKPLPLLKPGRLSQGETIKDDWCAIYGHLSGPDKRPLGCRGGMRCWGEGMGERGGGRGGGGGTTGSVNDGERVRQTRAG